MAQELDALQKLRQEAGLDDQEIYNPKPQDDSEEIEEEIEEEEEDDDDYNNQDDDDEDDDDQDEKKSSQQKSKGVPYKQFNKLRQTLRETNRKLQEISNRDNKPVITSKEDDNEDLIMNTAKEMMPSGATEEQIKSTAFQLKKILELNSKQYEKALESFKSELAEIKDKDVFGNEWRPFENSLKKEYPNATKQQIDEAQEIMDKLAHSENFADKELDYVFWKNKDIFSKILVQRKSKTFESRQHNVPREEDNDNDDEEDNKPPRLMEPAKLEKLHQKMMREAAEEDQRTGWKIKKDGRTII